MKEHKYLMSQMFSLVISILLVFVFFVLLTAGLETGMGFLSELILIIIAIVLLAIFGVLNQINMHLRGGKR